LLPKFFPLEGCVDIPQYYLVDGANICRQLIDIEALTAEVSPGVRLVVREYPIAN